ncbi:MAG TPA: tetratricopeptide repeat protein, partial [Kofleriaceae bacterium]|nr:tetratricopeptide repeat protein [Kofleriaceae bacterium]
LQPKNKLALYVTAELAMRNRDQAEAKKRYFQLLAAGADSADIRNRIAMLARMANSIPGAEKHLRMAKKLDPEQSYPYAELAQIYEAAGRTDDALRELETFVMIEQMQYGPLKKLIEGYKLKKNWAKVVKFGEMALNIDPFDAQLHLDLGTAQLETGATDAAIFSLESALIARPELRRPALAHLGLARAHAAKNNKRAAKAALKQALKYEPSNAEALTLKKTIK